MPTEKKAEIPTRPMTKQDMYIEIRRYAPVIFTCIAGQYALKSWDCGLENDLLKTKELIQQYENWPDLPENEHPDDMCPEDIARDLGFIRDLYELRVNRKIDLVEYKLEQEKEKKNRGKK